MVEERVPRVVLERKHTLRETLQRLRHVELTPESRFWFGSPCRFVRSLDVLIHVALPEWLEDLMPRFAKYLRQTSPRWGRSWRSW
ncbi:MAG: hypothetical protein EBU84_13555 [Actinobacteria bacterium]|nr:hypothetical protein [Actinomycetota bacterium]